METIFPDSLRTRSGADKAMEQTEVNQRLLKAARPAREALASGEDS